MNLIQTPTVPSAAESILLQTEQQTDDALRRLHAATVDSFRRFWHGPVPPADLLAVMGTHAGAAFIAHGRTVAYLAAAGLEIAPADCTPPLPYTLHADGRITLDAPAD